MQVILVISLITLWLIVLTNLLLTFALIRRVNQMSAFRHERLELDILPVGEASPAFELQTLEGQLRTNDDFMGQKHLVTIISPTCQPCKERLPEFAQLHKELQGSGTQLSVVSIGEKEATTAMIDGLLPQLPILVAPRENNEFFSNYKIAATPLYYLISADGTVEQGGLLDEKWVTLKQQLSSLDRQDVP